MDCLTPERSFRWTLIQKFITRIPCDVIVNKFSLPLVSVIIVNYGYGCFLRDAVNSVFSQHYPHIECIIVDNASTDDGSDILIDLSRQFPGAKIVRRKDNGGQSLASKEGFEASSGEYIRPLA